MKKTYDLYKLYADGKRVFVATFDTFEAACKVANTFDCDALIL